MPDLSWYWRRAQAMNLPEVIARIRRKGRQIMDARRDRDWAAIRLEAGDFPALPGPGEAPPELVEILRRDGERIMAGHWRAFGGLPLKVEDPPQWHRDYLAAVSLPTTRSAFQLDHRALPQGADIKLIWELSRWLELVRLAQAARLLPSERAAEKCLLWLEDWIKHNPPFRGWNWISALESGTRLLQFTWIDALLSPLADQWGFEAELETLRYEILPPHAWHCWRHRSFGSSANNHLLGELAGLIVALGRWPALAHWAAPLPKLKALFEAEILKQFAPDGGHREQALNYHLYALEFCLQARLALRSAGLPYGPSIEDRLSRAAVFYAAAQQPADPWDYGDSDEAYVSPLFADSTRRVREWIQWLENPASSPAIQYWLKGETLSAGPPTVDEGTWRLFTESGQAVLAKGGWFWRWDLSPLGYLSTAAHGHLDALHLSLWRHGVAWVVDPGTGAYYAQPDLRAWLAGRAAHNTPCPLALDFPRRAGPFLWREGHGPPQVKRISEVEMQATLELAGCRVSRRFFAAESGNGWTVEDACGNREGQAVDFAVRWQFAPGTVAEKAGADGIILRRGGEKLTVLASGNWSSTRWVATREESGGDHPLAGTVSPHFRRVEFAPYWLLEARAGAVPKGKPCVFRTTFLA